MSTDTARTDVRVSLWRNGAYEVRVRDDRGLTPLAGRVRLVPPIGPTDRYVAERPDGSEIETFEVETQGRRFDLVDAAVAAIVEEATR